MHRLPQLFAVVLLAAFVLLSADALRRGWEARRGDPTIAPGWILGGVGFFAIVAALFRFAWVSPAFAHGDFAGPQIVDEILSFPELRGSRFMTEHGPVSFIVLGAATKLFGSSAEGVIAANAAISVLATAPLAVVAAQWAGRPSAALYASAAWATSPLVGRLARSEDAHVVGAFFALSALALTEAALRLRCRRLLAGAVVAALLVLMTRQTYLPWVLMLVVLVLERLRAEPELVGALGRRWLALGLAALALPMVLRWVGASRSDSGYEVLLSLVMVFSDAGMVLDAVVDHPLLAVLRLGPVVPTLGLLGCGLLLARPRRRVAFGLAFALLFGLSLSATLSTVGVRWSFRLPLYLLALLGVGVGGVFLERRWEAVRAAPRPAVLVGAALAIAALGWTTTGAREVHAPDPELAEYAFIRDALASQPRPFTLITYPEGAPGWWLPEMIARRMDIPTVSAADVSFDPDRPPDARYLFVEGSGCHTWSVPDLLGFPRGPAGQMADTDEARLRAQFQTFFDRRRGYGLALIERPAEMREECARVLAHAETVERGPAIELRDKPPMSVYDAGGFRPRLVAIRAAVDVAPP